MDINIYLGAHGKMKHIAHGYIFKDVAPAIICADGFEMSVQASTRHYCDPRLDFGPYTHVEVSCIEHGLEFESLLEPFYDGSIYTYVPVEIVEEVIAKHGGIK